MRNKRSELHIEEIIQDKLGSVEHAIELPLTRGVFYIFYFIMLFVVGVFAFRILMLGIKDEELYTNRAIVNANKEVYLRAPRGIIYDRYKKRI